MSDASATQPSALSPKRSRAHGALLGLGGSAEYVGLWLKQAGHETLFFYYVSCCILCTFLTALALRETRGHSALDLDGVPD